jgi:hypothetical protein
MEATTVGTVAERREGEEQSTLRRAIGPRLLTVFIVGDILGAALASVALLVDTRSTTPPSSWRSCWPSGRRCGSSTGSPLTASLRRP